MSAFRLLPVILLLPAAPLAAGEAEDLKKLNGVWKGWVMDGTGDDPKQRRVKIEVTIDGNTITATEDGKKDLGAGTFTVKHTADGKLLDATRTRGPGSRPGAVYEGIYSLDGDTLKWCVANPPGGKRPRPAELRSKTGQFLIVLTKEK